MSSEDELKKLLKNAFRPTILVKTTPDVEKIMEKNGLRFIDLLRPNETVKKDSNLNLNSSFKLPSEL
jgi:hypothetical protein